MSKAGGARKRPVRYGPGAAGEPGGLAEALRAHRKGRLDEARGGYRGVLAVHPGCLDAWMNLGSLGVAAGSAREASEAFEQALALSAGDARALRDAGMGLAAIGRAEAARAALEAAVALDPALLGARLALVRVCAEAGERAAAAAHARQAAALAPLAAQAHLELARALFDDLDPEPSRRAAARAVELDPGHALARLFLAGALLTAGRADEARAALGPAGLVAEGLADALRYALAREPRPRAFATKRETLRFALSLAALPGAVAELGVRHGVTARVLAEGAEEVHGFDTFTGLPEAWQARAAGAFSTAGELPDVPPNVRLHVGLFDRTLPGFVAGMGSPLRLIHVDSDLYASARTALFALAPLVRPGCVLVFDQYIGNASWRDDEHRALAEASAAFGWRCGEPALSWITGQGVVLVRSVEGA